MKKKLMIIPAMILTLLASCADSAGTSPVSSETSPQEVTEKEDIILTMASRGISRYRIGSENFIDRFNEADNGYKIIEVDYGEYFDGGNESASEDWIDRDRELTLDIMQGGVVDIVPNIFNDHGKYISLAEKGAFADLNNFIENDPETSGDVLFSHVLETVETNGQLAFMPLSFSISTITGKSEYVGYKENWSLDELKKRWAEVPPDLQFAYSNTKDKVYYTLLRGNLNSFIDYDNAECYFDSQEFTDILDFINTFDEPLSYKEETDYKPFFITETRISSFQSWHDALWNTENDDITFVGYPSADGNGAFIDISENQIAISASSSPEKQQGAWEFIKLLISEEYQSNITHPPDVVINGTNYSFPDCGFPINYNVFRKQGEEQYINEEKENIIEIAGMSPINIGYLKKSEYDRLVDYINSIQVSTSLIESELKSIIEDEIWAVFAGELTSAEASANIQNRVSILVSERYE
ncbi:MAG: extracellular solute-binding protein [Ruminococcus flavefaciens]|nr:extracellular solute-binding protein [Ruminococcus flavefaciens]MCM1229342.1 extracellular solute-binding protein [Ruminococcus flavefaciens]